MNEISPTGHLISTLQEVTCTCASIYQIIHSITIISTYIVSTVLV